MRRTVAQYRLAPDAFSDPAKISEHVTNLNKLLQNLGDRLDTIQQVGATAPPTPQGLTVEGKQGFLNIAWQRVENCDGYVLCWSAVSGMVPLLGRYTLHDQDAANYRLPTGNTATTLFFTVSAFKGNKASLPSASVSAASVVFSTSTDAAPKNALLTPRAALVAIPRNGTTLA